MGILDIFRKCVFCKKKGNLIYTEYENYNYHYRKIFFHKGCLKKIVCNPETFSYKTIELTKKIVDSLQTLENKKHDEQIMFKYKCQELKRVCIEQFGDNK